MLVFAMKTKPQTNNPNHSTIAAIATAPGHSAIGIIRISGPLSKSALLKLWQPLKQQTLQPRMMCLGWIEMGGKRIDQALAVYMPGPNSYTGEDMIELQTHGSPAVLNSVLDELLAQGVEPAAPGEFTKRAFLNGKIDLAQAEAIGELIASENARSARLATSQLAGGLSKKIGGFKAELLRLSSHLAADLDFSEEDIPTSSPTEDQAHLTTIRSELRDIIKLAQREATIRDGFQIALVGLPNAGKSSLLNALIGYERSIVTNIAGTTRDTISERITLESIPFVLTDTAGLNQAPDQVEKIGIAKTLESIAQSDLILLLIEPGADEATQQYLRANKLSSMLNKSNTSTLYTKDDTRKNTPPKSEYLGIKVSAKTGAGLNELKTHLIALAGNIETNENVYLLSRRQISVLTSVDRTISDILAAYKDGITADVILVEYQKAIMLLNSLTGEDSTEDLLTEIFTNFCIGK